MTAALYVVTLLISGCGALLMGFMLGAAFMVSYYRQKERKK